MNVKIDDFLNHNWLVPENIWLMNDADKEFLQEQIDKYTYLELQ